MSGLRSLGSTPGGSSFSPHRSTSGFLDSKQPHDEVRVKQTTNLFDSTNPVPKLHEGRESKLEEEVVGSSFALIVSFLFFTLVIILFIAWGQATFKYGVWLRDLHLHMYILHVCCIFEKFEKFQKYFLLVSCL